MLTQQYRKEGCDVISKLLPMPAVRWSGRPELVFHVTLASKVGVSEQAVTPTRHEQVGRRPSAVLSCSVTCPELLLGLEGGRSRWGRAHVYITMTGW